MWICFYLFGFGICSRTIAHNSFEDLSLSSIEHNSLVDKKDINESHASIEKHMQCVKQIIDMHDVSFLENGDILVKSYNSTTHPSKLVIVKNGLHLCLLPTKELKKEIFRRCEKWLYEANEYQKLQNGSIMLYDEILPEGTYDFDKNDKLVMCSVDYDYVDDKSDDKMVKPKVDTDVDIASMYIGKIGCSISILALIAHIVTFCLVPSLRNLPGNNLVSLSIALLLAYSFMLIGQIPEVLGTFCVVSAVLQQYFFLVSFFWMNVMAFDVWKTLKMATERLMVSTETARRRQFLWYSLYAWLIPLGITVISVVIDKSKSIHDTIKPKFGRGNVCWITNDIAKGIFFLTPAFTLFLINAVFFILSAFILKQNTMKNHNDSEHRNNAKLNFFLYIRLALMMGITWLTGVIAILSRSTVVWFFFDVLNSLQGLLVFLLFTCSRKVFRHIQDKMGVTNTKSESDKNTTYSTKSDSRT